MYFLIEDESLLEIYNTIWNKISSDIKKEFDSERADDKNFLKTEIKSYGDNTTDFYYKEMSKAGSDYTCLAVINVDSALKEDENYYLQVSLKGCSTSQKKSLGILLIRLKI